VKDNTEELDRILNKNILGSIAISIPLSVNHIYGVNPWNRQIYLKKSAKDIVVKISEELKNILPENWESISEEWSEGYWIVVDVDTYDDFKHDLSNRHYLMSNGIEKGIGIDDRNFLFRDIHRIYSPDNQRVILTIKREAIGTDKIVRKANSARR
jgi:hypothetical protein